jgi:hypothetical protein
MTITNDYSNSAPYAEGYSFDFCGQHASSNSDASYHTHVPPSCLLAQLGQTSTTASPQLGWAVDGFPVFGPRGTGGILVRQCTEATANQSYCVDACGGYYGDLGDGFLYRYHIMGAYKEILSCANDLWYAYDVGNVQQCTAYASWQSTFYPFTPLCLKGSAPIRVNLPYCIVVIFIL